MSLPTISPAEANRLIAQGATLIDIRDPNEHARERIPAARNIPLGELNKLEGLTGPIVFHCKAGKRTADNAALGEAAHCQAYLLAGGIEGWKQAGLPVTIDQSQPIEIGRQVMIAAGSLVVAFVVLGYLLTPYFFVLAGLIGLGLAFGGISGWCGMAKLLALMPWNQAPNRA